MTTDELTQKIEPMLHALTATGRYKGTRCCRVATRLAIERAGELTGILRATAAECGTTYACVHHNLRTLSDHIWQSSREQLRDYAGARTLEGPPSPLDLIDTLATHILQKRG